MSDVRVVASTNKVRLLRELPFAMSLAEHMCAHPLVTVVTLAHGADLHIGDDGVGRP